MITDMVNRVIKGAGSWFATW